MPGIDLISKIGAGALTGAARSVLGGAEGPGDVARTLQVPVLGDKGVQGAADAGQGSFAQTLLGAINEVSASQDRASDYTARFVRGEQVSLHQVMAATEEAQLSAQMLLEVRNKVMDAYRSLINMQS